MKLPIKSVLGRILFPLRNEIRWFHYLRLQMNEEGWKVTFRMLRQDLARWVDIYSFGVAWD